jgi:hypothetical protein
MAQIAADIRGDTFKGAMAKATLLVQRDARKNAPVDRGTLRASIMPEVVQTTTEVQGIVGSNLRYAPYMELGTRPFHPPWTPIFEWARRKLKGDMKGAGALASAVIRGIAARGIVAKKFLQRALDDNAEKIYDLLNKTVRMIVEK